MVSKLSQSQGGLVEANPLACWLSFLNTARWICSRASSVPASSLRVRSLQRKFSHVIIVALMLLKGGGALKSLWIGNRSTLDRRIDRSRRFPCRSSPCDSTAARTCSIRGYALLDCFSSPDPGELANDEDSIQRNTHTGPTSTYLHQINLETYLHPSAHASRDASPSALARFARSQSPLALRRPTSP